MSFFDVSGCLGRIAQRVSAIDHGMHLAGLREGGEEREIIRFCSRDEEYEILADDERPDDCIKQSTAGTVGCRRELLLLRDEKRLGFRR
jgi:hypothetical protein